MGRNEKQVHYFLASFSFAFIGVREAPSFSRFMKLYFFRLNRLENRKKLTMKKTGSIESKIGSRDPDQASMKIFLLKLFLKPKSQVLTNERFIFSDLSLDLVLVEKELRFVLKTRINAIN